MRAVTIVLLGAAALGACRPARPDTRIAPAVQNETPSADRTAGTAPVAVQSGALAGGPREGSSAGGREAASRVTSAAESRSPSNPGAAAESAPTWDIAVAPYETHDRVEFYVRRYTGPARSWARERLARGTRYEAMIREKLRAGGVPEDFYYIAFVESGFDPQVSSRAAAVGMWQFMAQTAKGVGLRVDWWVDERRDPVRSTEAAARFLRYLNDQFESSYLAAAAYNGGPGRVARGLTRYEEELEGTDGEDRFFALSEQDALPRETREYVPQIIAAALIGKDPARYGMSFEPREPFAYDSVAVPAMTSLPAIARAAGTTIAAIRELNPHLIRGVTAPRRTSTVRIPVGSREGFDRKFGELTDTERSGVRRVQLEKVTSLANAAKQFSTTSAAIRTFNPNLKRTPKGNLAEGQTLLIPDADVAAAALTIPDPGSGVLSTRFHVVKAGETLGHIALRNGTTVATLMRLNHLRKPMIFPGQELVVTGKPAARKPAKRKAPKPQSKRSAAGN
jgi:membrane-bound lytic murein transglycosylase D